MLAADASQLESEEPVWTVAPGSGPGIASARGDDTSRLTSAVEEAGLASEIVVAYLHWGEEGSAYPTQEQESLAAELAEAGASVVVGTHAHRPQAAGMLGETYVGYGLGNFLWYNDSQTETGVLTLSVSADGEVVNDAWHPARIPPGGGAPEPLSGDERAEALADWSQLRSGTDLIPVAGERGGGEDASEDDLPEFTAQIQPLDDGVRQRMGGSHDPAVCPVPLDDLRLIDPLYVGFDGQPHRGELIVHAEVADDVREVLEILYEERFPIRRMQLTGAYGGDDVASMAENNTSGYNCRPVEGSESWSDHAYGRAVDINPLQNPYVTGGDVFPDDGRHFLDVDRSAGAPERPGVISQDGVVARAFAERGWIWGGTWTEPDYQHFSAA